MVKHHETSSVSGDEEQIGRALEMRHCPSLACQGKAALVARDVQLAHHHHHPDPHHSVFSRAIRGTHCVRCACEYTNFSATDNEHQFQVIRFLSAHQLPKYTRPRFLFQLEDLSDSYLQGQHERRVFQYVHLPFANGRISWLYTLRSVFSLIRHGPNIMLYPGAFEPHPRSKSENTSNQH